MAVHTNGEVTGFDMGGSTPMSKVHLSTDADVDEHLFSNPIHREAEFELKIVWQVVRGKELYGGA